MKKRLASLSPDELHEMASRSDTVVMQPTYDTVFEPWPQERLLQALEKLQSLSLSLNSKSKTMKEAEKDPTLSEMKQKYKLLFERVCDPDIAGNVQHMNTIFFMVSIQTKLANKEIKEEDAKAMVSDRALASLMKQVPSDNQ